MNEQEIRALVRSVIARRDEANLHAHSADALPAHTSAPGWRDAPVAPVRQHSSHALFVIPAQGEACIIEPAVSCTHCGYCKSYGH